MPQFLSLENCGVNLSLVRYFMANDDGTVTLVFAADHKLPLDADTAAVFLAAVGRKPEGGDGRRD